MTNHGARHVSRVRAVNKRWPRRYALRLRFTDAVILAATLSGYFFVASAFGEPLGFVSWPGDLRIPYGVALLVIGVIWMFALDAADSLDDHVIGHGATEYDRVFRATLTACALVIAVAFFLRLDLARVIFLVVFPVGLVMLMLTRWMWRQWLRGRQRSGQYEYRTVVIGETRKAEHIIKTLNGADGTGMKVIGVLTEQANGMMVDGVPVLGEFAELERVAAQLDVDTVVFAGADQMSPRTIRRIGWNMADLDIDWIVVPSLTDVAGPRIHSRPVAGLPLVHVSFPRLDGARRFLKRGFDVVGSAALILLLSPVLLAVAAAVRFTSPGPVLYSQERIGRNGVPFRMLKFRSMVTDADERLAELLDAQGRSDQPLFKIEDDPRITPVGRFIRKYSLDELPQLSNVLRGEMSLVGPRPQREAEVALYDHAAHRRLMVKPGMSGLWQVSGRSTLSWEDTIRLDLYYVENWSFMQDIVILFRTVKAVTAPGASAH